jgi:hypothetical protein
MRRSTTTALVAALPATGVTPVLTGPAAAAPAKHYDDWGGLPD